MPPFGPATSVSSHFSPLSLLPLRSKHISETCIPALLIRIQSRLWAAAPGTTIVFGFTVEVRMRPLLVTDDLSMITHYLQPITCLTPNGRVAPSLGRSLGVTAPAMSPLLLPFAEWRHCLLGGGGEGVSVDGEAASGRPDDGRSRCRGRDRLLRLGQLVQVRSPVLPVRTHRRMPLDNAMYRSLPHLFSPLCTCLLSPPHRSPIRCTTLASWMRGKHVYYMFNLPLAAIDHGLTHTEEAG